MQHGVMVLASMHPLYLHDRLCPEPASNSCKHTEMLLLAGVAHLHGDLSCSSWCALSGDMGPGFAAPNSSDLSSRLYAGLRSCRYQMLSLSSVSTATHCCGQLLLALTSLSDAFLDTSAVTISLSNMLKSNRAAAALDGMNLSLYVMRGFGDL